MDAKDYFKNKGIEPSTTFICEYCGLEKPNNDASLITIAVCKDCYDLDPAALRAEVARLEAENEKMREEIGIADKALAAISRLRDNDDPFWAAERAPIIASKAMNDIAELSALSPSADESESKQPTGLVGSPVGKLSEREYQLKHSNPYDAAGLPKEPTDE